MSKTFGVRRVLTSASLRAVPGELRVLFGRNGEGKSTLLRIAAGIIAPDSGAVRFRENVRLSWRLDQLAAEGLFFLPDYDLFSRAFSVRSQLTMIQRRYNGGDVVEAAERMGVGEHLNKKPYEMSGGELRRMEVAAVFVRRPVCFLADEPYRGVAPVIAEHLT
ncbi:MAG: ATP-binding cassette domain-containing protein, partial [Gemmatimonadaceae bacterium]|nr:ATP-binding cassette domain-containing protein [Gemmatimonadaceae bacterium]